MHETAYGSSEYWDERYKITQQMDWYFGWDIVCEFIAPVARKDKAILEIGCGDSGVGVHMHVDGYCDITCVDISVNIIAKMQSKHQNKPGLKFLQMDVKELTFVDESFYLGTTDAILCGKDGFNSVNKMYSEICRVLAIDGYYVIFSYAQEELRKFHLENFPWSISVAEVTVGSEKYFVYTMKKQATCTTADPPNLFTDFVNPLYDGK